MARRLPSPPPALPGFTPVRVLGSGGFADVYLFEQNMPRRQVAVKVMLPEVVNEQVRRMFRVEADLMATLSAHPSILTVYEAGVSSDGRPYIVMELCSSSLGQRYRSRPLPVPEVLRIGVKIAGALQTAHDRGILHRDVKPSNILLTAYGAPVLSDFGISSSTRVSTAADGVGLSVPWSAPEVVSEATQGTVASEVWALSATLYSLLAGRSPFEVPGESSAAGELARRIAKARPAPIGRPDVPDSLERLLRAGLSKNPADRPASALELLRELQGVETELGFAATGAEIAMAEWAADFARDPAEATVLAAPVAPSGTGSAPGSTPGSRTRTRSRTRERTRPGERSSAEASAAADATPRSRRIRTIVISASAALLVAIAVTVGLLLQPGAEQGIPRVGEISTTSDGGRVLFSWDDPGIVEGDSYRVVTADGRSSIQTGREFVASPAAGEQVCITVAVLRAGRPGPVGAERCAGTG